MFDFHGDRMRYFDMQIQNTHDYVIPFIEEQYPIAANMRVLEIGCGEGGVLKAFIDKGCTGIGVELDNARIEYGSQWLQEEIQSGKIKLISKNIYEVDAKNEFDGGFDIIVLKDVIEHIHDQQKLINRMKTFLNDNGVIFFWLSTLANALWRTSANVQGEITIQASLFSSVTNAHIQMDLKKERRTLAGIC